MFSRNDRSRVTVARGSALEMEFKRGRFRLSLFSDQPEVSARIPPSLPLPDSRSRGRLYPALAHAGGRGRCWLCPNPWWLS